MKKKWKYDDVIQKQAAASLCSARVHIATNHPKNEKIAPVSFDRAPGNKVPSDPPLAAALSRNLILKIESEVYFL